jgi:glutamate synthase domain-containing protein 1
MLGTLCDRGPDSAGFAVYGAEFPAHVKMTLRAPARFDWDGLLRQLASISEAPLRETIRDTHAVIAVPFEKEPPVRAEIARTAGVDIVGTGRRMEIFKEVGRPDRVAERFGLGGMSGTHAIGHTRMATESAVTTNGAHPFTTGPDQCLVHNGSLSNHNRLRRELRREGMEFQTENDTEVAAAYLTWRLREGASLEQALEGCLDDLDGFYTFLVGTADGFAVLRDPIACKPAVLAETDDWVAMASEYRAIAVLPGASDARIWEPEPSVVYAWEKAPV